MKFFILMFLCLLSWDSYARDSMLRVAVIDSGLDIQDTRFNRLLCDGPIHADFTDEGIKDIIGHGTHVTGIIKSHAGRDVLYCFIIIKYFSYKNSNEKNISNMEDSIKWAIIKKADIVNISSSGFTRSEEEYRSIKSNPKIKFVVAAGNHNLDIDKNPFYPARYDLPNIYVVGALNKDGDDRLPMSNYGSKVRYWEIGEDVISTLPDVICKWNYLIPEYMCRGKMTGSSMSTAVVTGKLLYNY